MSVKPLAGYSPLLPLNEQRVVGLPPLVAMLNTVPSPFAPPCAVVP